MPNVGEAITNQDSCEPADRSEMGCFCKASSTSRLNSTVDGVESQTRILNDDNTVSDPQYTVSRH